MIQLNQLKAWRALAMSQICSGGLARYFFFGARMGEGKTYGVARAVGEAEELVRHRCERGEVS